MTNDIFIHADQSLMVIFNAVAREFQSMGTSLGFDELNALETRKRVNDVYARLDGVARREYRRIARKAREYAIEALIEMDFALSDGGFDAAALVDGVLNGYDPVSDFVYTREWERKRDRLFESVIATETGNQDMRRNLKRGMDVLANHIRQYADNITVAARLEAFRRAGVRYVRWVSVEDEKRCRVCAERDGMVYRIDEVPVIPAHWHCRCHLYPATEEEYLAHSLRR